MAKASKKYVFSKANISIENGRYIITEIEKDGCFDYNLSNIIDEFIDKDGVSLSIGLEGEIEPLNE